MTTCRAAPPPASRPRRACALWCRCTLALRRARTLAYRRPRTLAYRRRRAVAALEFALILPVMTVLLMGMVDLARAMIVYRRLNATVQQIGLMATALSVQPDQTTNLTVAALNEASSVIFAILPDLLNQPVYNATTNPVPSYAVVVSDVVFTPTASGCKAGLTCTAYTASLAWSVPLQYGQHINRTCGTVTQTSPTQNPVIQNNLPSTVPTAQITNALTSVLIVDVVYQFQPVFGRFFGTVTLRQTGYFNERSFVAAYITYNIASAASGGVICTGYT